MMIKNEQEKAWDIRLRSSNQKDFNLNVSIYMSKEVAERVIVILLTFILGVPISFCTAWYVSNQALSGFPLEKSEDSGNPNSNLN